MKNLSKKISINVPIEKLGIIDRYVQSIPNMNRSQFMIESTLQNIATLEDATFISHKEKKGIIMCHLAEISNLTNGLRNEEKNKELIQKEVLNLWRCLN